MASTRKPTRRTTAKRVAGKTAPKKKPPAKVASPRRHAPAKAKKRAAAAPPSTTFVPPIASARIQRLLSPVTAESIRVEALALPASSVRGTIATGDLVADANELLAGREDLPALKERCFPLNEHFFDRVSYLVTPLAAFLAEGARLRTASADATAEAENARQRLLEIRRRLAAYADAVGLPSEWFALGLRKSDRLNLVSARLAVVLAQAEAARVLLPDPEAVEALIAEGTALVERHTAVRVDRAVTRSEATISTDLADRYETLLLEALQHGAKVGAAAFADDPTREARYRLQHVYGEAASPVAPVEDATDAPVSDETAA